MANATFSPALNQGSRQGDWNTTPRSAPGWSTSFPLITTPPYVAFWSPAMIDSTVDLPQPECPRMQTNSPGLVMKLTFCTAVYGPDGVGNIFVIPVASSGGLTVASAVRDRGEGAISWG